MTVKEFKKNIDPQWEAVKLVDRKGRFVGSAEHRDDWDEAEVKSWEVIKRDGFPNFYVVTI